MKMAKCSERDIDAAGDAMSVLQDISSGYYPHRDGDDDESFGFDPDDFAHLRKFYDLINATLDASPGWPGRVIGGMCFVIMFDQNKIIDPDADTLEIHPRFAAIEEERNRFKAALESILALPVGQQMLDKLASGWGTDTDDGRAWLAAKALLTPPAQQEPL